MNRRELLRLTAFAGIGGPSMVRAQLQGSTIDPVTSFVFSNDGTRIAYEVIGDGPPLVLQHGALSNRNRWRETGYVEALLEQFRLILIDARGHGESDGPSAPEAYSHERVAEDVAAVVDAECDEPATYWGYSMGGRIGFSCMAHTPHLYRRFVIGAHGSSVFGAAEEVNQNRIARAEMFERGLEAMGSEERERFRDSNLPALAAYSRQSAVFDPTLREMLNAFEGPTLFYIGGQDAEVLRSQETAAGRRLIDFLADPTYVEISGGLSHSETHTRSDLVLPEVLQFLART